MSSASLLLERLIAVDRKLGATYYNGAFSKEKELEGQAVTFMCFLENVFGHFYEWKTRIVDYCEIPATYAEDWRNFYNALEKSVQDKQAFNGICPVMHITTEWQDRGRTLVITDMGLRPCAIDKSFFRVALRMIAQNLLLKDSKLVIKIFGIRSQFVRTAVQETDVKPVESMEDKDPGRPNSVHVFTYDAKHIKQLRDQPSIRTWAVPLANELNSRAQWTTAKTELVRRMLQQAGPLFKDILDKTSNTTYILPDVLCLREKDLWVFKYGSQIRYCPQVELESFDDDVGVENKDEAAEKQDTQPNYSPAAVDSYDRGTEEQPSSEEQRENDFDNFQPDTSNATQPYEMTNPDPDMQETQPDIDSQETQPDIDLQQTRSHMKRKPDERYANPYTSRQDFEPEF